MKTRVSQHDAPVVKKRQDAPVPQVRRYKLITPLFGGGVEPNRADSITIVRGTEVRGQLRFWWRATRGGQFNGSLDKMRRREEEIWGGIAAKDKPRPSQVSIYMQCLSSGILDHPFEVVAGKRGRPIVRPRQTSFVPPYAAFSLQPEKENARIGMETDSVRVGVEFTLEICYPGNLKQDVQAALWAWETFGGLGARTRRGFGALQLVSIDDESVTALARDQVEIWLRNQLQQHVVSGRWPENVPHLSRNLRMKVIVPSRSQPSSSIQVWNELIQCLQDFRQKRHKRMGLSLWPEANEIRHRLNRAIKWPPRFKLPRLVHKFPRAVFGLPIVFHLPHDKDLPAKSFTIQGKPDPDSASKKTFERMASVLILKPIPCDNGGAVGIAAVLDAPVSPPYGLEIKELVQDKQSVEWQLDRDEANSVPIREILHGQADVIEAFLNSLDTIARK
jgi:CRISPR-associated protein Cmr1